MEEFVFLLWVSHDLLREISMKFNTNFCYFRTNNTKITKDNVEITIIFIRSVSSFMWLKTNIFMNEPNPLVSHKSSWGRGMEFASLE